MEYKDFQNQVQSDVVKGLEEIDAFDIIEDEQRVAVVDSCDESVFSKYSASDTDNSSVISNDNLFISVSFRLTYIPVKSPHYYTTSVICIFQNVTRLTL